MEQGLLADTNLKGDNPQALSRGHRQNIAYLYGKPAKTSAVW